MSVPPPPIDTDVAIETPEHIVFRHRLAGPARRAVAQVLDLIICYGALVVIALVVFLLAAGAGAVGAAESVAKTGIGLLLILLFFAQWCYFAAWEAARGRTPGKMALGLRVVTTSGRPIGFAAAALRNLLRVADLLPMAYATGVVAMALTARFQRLGDLVAGTMVIIPERARVLEPVRLVPPPQPAELEAMPSHVALDADERAAIELFLRRRVALGHARAEELAAMIAEPIGKRFGLRVGDPVRALALLYDRAANAGRDEAPVSSRLSRAPGSWRGAPPSRRASWL